MAGAIRQALDTEELERYLDANVNVIRCPIEIKQVIIAKYCSITSSLITNCVGVWIWPVKPHLPIDRERWTSLRSTQEAARATVVSESPSD